jgi:hypothetical protein
MLTDADGCMRLHTYALGARLRAFGVPLCKVWQPSDRGLPFAKCEKPMIFPYPTIFCMRG